MVKTKNVLMITVNRCIQSLRGKSVWFISKYNQVDDEVYLLSISLTLFCDQMHNKRASPIAKRF